MASLFDGTERMEDIDAILGQMKANIPHPSSTSRGLWKLRQATQVAPHNTGRETMLEKAVAMLAAKGHMPGWFNQCPTASGIGDSSRTRHSSVDLVHWNEADGHVRLIELKWDSDGPSKAMRQSLRLAGRGEKIHEMVCRCGGRVPIREVCRARSTTATIRTDLGVSGTLGTCGASNASNETRRS